MRIERSDGTVVIRLHGEGELERADQPVQADAFPPRLIPVAP
jgi:hypothetical protein